MKTSNYDQFKLIKTNRLIQNGLVKRLKASIQNIGYIEARPILVNERMEIIDGQNRFIACQELGLPIIYSIHNSNASDDVIIAELNKNQLVWRLQDFVHHFAEQGVKYHSIIRDFEERYHLGASNAIVICSENQTGNTKAIREGKNKPLNPRREEVAEFILSCNGLFFYKNKNFVHAVFTLYKKANNEQIAKVMKKHLSIPQQASMSAYMTIFSNIINKNCFKESRINF